MAEGWSSRSASWIEAEASWRRHAAFLLAGLLFLFTHTRTSHTDEPQPQGAAVPFELLPTHHMAVSVTINGKGPYRVIFDTGAPFVILSNRVAREAGLKAPRAAGGPAPPLFGFQGQTQVDTLMMGALKAEQVPALVMDHPGLGVLAKQVGPIEGIIGWPFFARYRLTIDYQAQRLTFVPTGYEPPDVLAALLQSLQAPAQPRVLAPAGQWGMVVEKDHDDSDPGVVVRAVLPGSAAERGGLRASDRMLTLDDRWTDSVADCYFAASQVPADSKAIVVVQRAGKKQYLTIQPRHGL
ncbi:MAG: aspartyl protease family protein [Gemmataceae bacterium]